MSAKDKLVTGQLPRSDFPIFARALVEDGILWQTDYGGVSFYLLTSNGHHYKATNAQIIKNWQINQSSWRRFIVWLAHHRPYSDWAQQGEGLL